MGGLAGVLKPNRLIVGGALLASLSSVAVPLGLGFVGAIGTGVFIQQQSGSVPQPGPVLNGPIPVPLQLIPVYMAAGKQYNVTWTVLAAIHYVETSFSMGNSPTSSAGAEGPMQFEPSTFAKYGVTAPGQSGPPNIQNVYDAIYTAAHYLSACGFSQNPFNAIYQYNHATWYVEKVMSIANEIGNMDVSVGASALGGNVYSAIMSEALKYQGYPYVYGGASPQTSFDCSGLVQWVYGKVGIHLPRTAQQQWDVTKHIPPSAAQPGDLVFFAHTYNDGGDVVTHVGIYVGNNMMYDADNSGVGYHTLSGYWMAHFYGFGRVS